VTTRLAEMLELDISCQRLDSTHVFSRMASFGRTKLMAVAIKRFLTQVRRHDPELYAALPEEFRRRYEPAESQLFSGAKDAEARQRSRQQAAEDLLWIIDRFADCAGMTGRSSYKALVRILAPLPNASVRRQSLPALRAWARLACPWTKHRLSWTRPLDASGDMEGRALLPTCVAAV